jgi:hypothetical protein
MLAHPLMSTHHSSGSARLSYRLAGADGSTYGTSVGGPEFSFLSFGSVDYIFITVSMTAHFTLELATAGGVAAAAASLETL